MTLAHTDPARSPPPPGSPDASLAGRQCRGPARAAIVAIIAIVLNLPHAAVTGVRAGQLPLWEAGLGATVISFPDYRGSDERRSWLLPFPYIVYRGEFLKADERRVRGLFFRTDRAELDVSVNGTPPVDSSENAARQGMPDLDATLEIGPSLNFLLKRSDDRRIRLELRLPVRAALATDLSHVNFAGWVFQPHLNVDLRDAFGHPGWNLGALAGPLFSDRRYNQYFYGVDPAFATAARPAYNASGGYAGAQFLVSLSKRFRKLWVGGFARWDTLNHAVFSDSPLVKTDEYFAAGVALAWMLGESRTRVETNGYR
jgi:outer membrane scaffolding protein for murein synthesis (MipA/OmpV family)